MTDDQDQIQSEETGGADEVAVFAVTEFTDPVELARFVLEINRGVISLERDPTSQLGDFVISSHERLTNRGGRRNTQDQYSEKLGTRSMGNGDDVDYAFEGGNATARLLGVPALRKTIRVLKSFRAFWRPTVATDAQQTRGDRQPARALIWDGTDQGKGVVQYLRDARTTFLDQGQTELADEIQRLLSSEIQLTLLGNLYNATVPLNFHVVEWAQGGQGHWELKQAALGDCYWVVDRNAPESYTHRYRGFMSPSKTWLDTRLKAYFDNHPRGSELRALLEETKPKEDSEIHPFGVGRLRHYSYLDLWAPDWAPDDRKAQVQQNLRNAFDHWRIRLHLWKAYEQAFREWAIDFRNCVEENRRLERESGAYQGSLDPLVNTEPYSGALESYFDTFVQSPLTFQYLLWQMVEILIQYRQETEDSDVYDGQSQQERIQALEKVSNIFSWIERLPRVWRDGKIYWHWYADPDHKRPGYNPDDRTTWEWDEDKGHCQGCQHWEYWLPTHLFVRTEHPTWVHEEVQVWYATRQEQQLFRKAIYSHNAGSGNVDASVYNLLTVAAIIQFRHAYGGGGNEAIPTRSWWVPGASTFPEPLPAGYTRLEDLRAGDLEAYNAYIERRGFVARTFWLGIIAEKADSGISAPYNSWMLESMNLRVKVMESRSKFEQLIGLNTTGNGVSADDLRKELAHIHNFHDGIVFPTGYGEHNGPIDNDGNQLRDQNRNKLLYGWGTDSLGRDWVDFHPIFDLGNPRMVLYRDPYFHIDWKWYRNRSYYDGHQVNLWIESFEEIFGRHKLYTMRWPDGHLSVTRADRGYFRDPVFRRYMIANWFSLKDLAKNFWENQDVMEFEETVREKLNQAIGEGKASLRPIIAREFDGLPLTEPRFDADGNVVGTQPNAFGLLKMRLLEEADNHAWKYIAIRAEGAEGARGFNVSEVGKHLDEGFGQGYGSVMAQYRRVLRLVELGLKCRYFDTYKGLVEAFSVEHVIEIEDIQSAIASALRSRSLNYDYALLVVRDLQAYGVLPADWFFASEKPIASDEMEDAWKSELLHMLVDGSEDIGSRMLEAMRLEVIWEMPNTRAGMTTFEAKEVLDRERGRVAEGEFVPA